ncbi:Nucleoside transporter/FeoB GTPase Gate domain-containing protein [Kosakonia sp. BK9b]|uniref:nucleoside recognition domain-containing protein n=1 Tax=Kosakonia sp. TaxID=1916651 RepID=UPI0028992954|nr:nucleoside recognition domain-containing protein [Kosakonia sp.]
MNIIEVIMSAGKVSVDVALYTLLPIMVVMLIIMKYLEEKGVLEVIVRITAPLLKPFGINGMGIFALIQLNFVSFAAPLASLALMEKRGTSDRHLAATLAMLFAMGQANVFYPLTPFGLHWGVAIIISLIGGLAASTLTWYVTGRKLSGVSLRSEEAELHRDKPRAGLISVINGAGADAIRLSLGSLPMLLLSLTVVGLLKAAGAVEALTALLTPVLAFFNISSVYVLLTLTKCMAGGTAYFGVASEMVQHGQLTAAQLNASAGLLVQTLDLPGIGIFLGIASRFVRLFRFALPGAIVGILIRTVLHAMVF